MTAPRDGAPDRARSAGRPVHRGADGRPFTTVQDLPGRVGYWHVGVPPNGPMDDLAHRLVNRVLGNRRRCRRSSS